MLLVFGLEVAGTALGYVYRDQVSCYEFKYNMLPVLQIQIPGLLFHHFPALSKVLSNYVVM